MFVWRSKGHLRLSKWILDSIASSASNITIPRPKHWNHPCLLSSFHIPYSIYKQILLALPSKYIQHLRTSNPLHFYHHHHRPGSSFVFQQIFLHLYNGQRNLLKLCQILPLFKERRNPQSLLWLQRFWIIQSLVPLWLHLLSTLHSLHYGHTSSSWSITHPEHSHLITFAFIVLSLSGNLLSYVSKELMLSFSFRFQFKISISISIQDFKKIIFSEKPALMILSILPYPFLLHLSLSDVIPYIWSLLFLPPPLL